MKDKEIEEMAKDLKEVETDVGHILVNETFSYVKEHRKYNSKKDFFNAHTKTFEELTAEEMFKKGYRKLPKDSVVLSREEKQEYENLAKLLIYDKPIKSRVYEFIKDTKAQARKETAEKFKKELYEFIYLCDDLNLNGDTYEKISNKIDAIAKQLGVEIKEKQQWKTFLANYSKVKFSKLY